MGGFYLSLSPFLKIKLLKEIDKGRQHKSVLIIKVAGVIFSRSSVRVYEAYLFEENFWFLDDRA